MKSYKISVVATVHSILILYGLYKTVADIVVEQYPISLHEISVIIIYYLFHAVLIGLLLQAHRKQIPVLYLPWTLLTTILMITMTSLWLQNVFEYGILYFTYFFINFVILGLGWLGCFLVGQDYILCYLRQKNRIKDSK